MGLARDRTPWMGVSYRNWLTIRPSRKPVISAKDRSRYAEGAGAPDCAAVCPGGVAAAEAAVGLGIVISMFRNRETVAVDEIDLLKW